MIRRFVRALLGSRAERLAEPQPPRGGRIALYLLFFVLGALVSLCGAFVQALWAPAGLLLALAGTLAVFYAGLRVTGTKLGAGIPLAGWFAVLLVLMTPRPEGDLVISTAVTSYLYLFFGSVGGVVCATLPTSSGYGFGVPPVERRQPVRTPRP
ncbi:DUF6113 family protein [Kitasatospora sp. MBT63]|uniref:DUF6113 family protein n=1 Tax=Kitasatospora sp. MBT63 TaxID=1444768 RepID=UPI0007C7AAEC|nr:DUF6113 family protein [Kitasatospora sp. MBT63]